MRQKARVMARTGVLPSLQLVAPLGRMICTLIERSVPTALAGAAQLRGFGNSCCWYVVFVHVLVLKTPSSLKSRMAAGSQPMPHTFNFLVNSNITNVFLFFSTANLF